MIRSITVYCSSSSALAPAYFDAGAAVGRALAENGWALVYGGNSVGLMKTVADAARAGGGRVVGITPQLMVDKGIHEAMEHFRLYRPPVVADKWGKDVPSAAE